MKTMSFFHSSLILPLNRSPIMRLIMRIVTLVLLGTLPVLLPGTAGAVADTLDQAQTQQNSWGMIGSGGGNGEVFTAGQSGYLDRVSLYLGQYEPDSTTAPVNISIETVTSEGLPSGTQIGYGSIPVNKIPSSGGWVDADINGAFVTAGTKYALLLSTGNGIVLWYMENGDVKPYPWGYWVTNTAGTWNKILTNQDWTFKTYVVPDTLDQNQSQTSGSGGGTRALGTTPVGQTFTVGLYGYLDRVSVYLTNSSTNPAPITVSILKVTSNGLPDSGTQVASGMIPVDAIPKPGYRSWASAGISPLIVTPGSKYAILLSTGGAGVQWVLVSNVYPGGTQVIKNGTSWTTTSYDFAFQTFVLQPILDQSQTQWTYRAQFGAGEPQNQSFTAHVSGSLDWVSVLLDRSSLGSATADVAVSISTYPSLELIRSGTIPLSAIPPNGSPGWLNASFSGVHVTAGSQYALTLDEPGNGYIDWYLNNALNNDTYPEGNAWGEVMVPADMTFKTYVLPELLMAPPGPEGITPCSNGVCPSASGGFTPADLTEGVTSHFQFQERPGGTVRGILNFRDPRPDGIALRGCTTESAACALTVTTFNCTDAHSVTVGGTYTPPGGTATNYLLTLSGVPDGPGTFTLAAGDYSFTMTLDGIVNVTCPPIATP